MWKYQQKEHEKYADDDDDDDDDDLHEESLVLLLDSPLHATSCFIVIRKQFCAMWKKQHVQQTVLWLCLGFTLPLSTVHMNKRGVWNKRRGWQNFPKLINGECWISLGRVAKNAIINKRGVPSIRNSRVDTENYRPVSVNLLYPKYSNVAFVIKSIQTLTIHWLGIKYAIERDTASTFIDCNVWKL